MEGDLKPENVLMRGHDSDTDFVIADFGFAKVRKMLAGLWCIPHSLSDATIRAVVLALQTFNRSAAPGTGESGGLAGTPEYLSPEVGVLQVATNVRVMRLNSCVAPLALQCFSRLCSERCCCTNNLGPLSTSGRVG